MFLISPLLTDRCASDQKEKKKKDIDHSVYEETEFCICVIYPSSSSLSEQDANPSLFHSVLIPMVCDIKQL